MKYRISGTWKTRVPVHSVDEAGTETTNHFVAEFKELGRQRMQGIERDRRRRLRRQIELRRQIDRLDRRLDELYRQSDEQQIGLTRAEFDALKSELVQLEDEAANSDVQLLDEVLVATHQLELEDEDGSILSAAETRQCVMDNIHLMLPTVQAFSDGITRAAEKNFGKSGAK